MSSVIIINGSSDRAPIIDAEDKHVYDSMAKNNVAQADLKIRMAFIRKVYGLLSMQLLLTISIVATFMYCEPIRESAVNALKTRPELVLLSLLFSSMGMIFALVWKRKEHPTNLILLATFTCFQGVLIGFATAPMVNKYLVLEALLITIAMVLALTFYTFQTRTDFTMCHAGMSAGLVVLIMVGFLQMFFNNDFLEIIVCIFGVTLFSLYIIYDTQMMLTKLSAEEYVLATINLYLDILNLFLYILRILSATKK